MEYVEPENVYRDFRKSFSEKIVPVIKQGLSFKIEGGPGVGKSKYLRYISSSETFHKKYFSKNEIKFFYIDLNLVYKNDSDILIQVICDVLEETNYSTKGIESNLKSQLEKFDKIYAIFDHAEKLTELDESSIKYLLAIRDLFKHRLGYVICQSALTYADGEKYKSLNELFSTSFVMGPLDKEELRLNIRHFAIQQNLELTDQEVNIIENASGGHPKYIKQILTDMLIGKTALEALDILKEESYDENTILDIAIKNFTKGEYMIFRELLLNKGRVITRDEIAQLMNPESIGEGVSNESIDQLISRIRKSIKKSKINIEIKTRRGVGYYC